MTINIIINIGAALVVSALCVVLLRPVARRFGLVDLPDERKQHFGIVPLVGGVALFLTFFLTYGLAHFNSPTISGYFLGASVVLLVGLLDDIVALSPRARFAAQGAAALTMIYWAGLQLDYLGDLFALGSVHTGLLAVPFTVFCVVGLINALNMLDGLDGLAGGVGLVCTLALALAAADSGGERLAVALLVFSAALGGFLIFNVRHRWRSERFRVFLGDSGSMLLGFTLVWAAVDLTQRPWAKFPPIVAVWLLGLPILDTVCIMLRRVLQGRSPLRADREHLHHLLLGYGFSEHCTVGLIILGTMLLSGTALLGWHMGVPDASFTGAFLVVGGMYFIMVEAAWRNLERQCMRDEAATTSQDLKPPEREDLDAA